MQSPTARQTEWLYRLLLALAGAGILALGLSRLALERGIRKPPEAGTEASSASSRLPPAGEHPDPADWQVFQPGPLSAEDPSGHALSSRYRLAGTFLVPGGADGKLPVRKAIVDELAEKRQKLVNEGDDLEPGVRVTRIESERVVLDASGETVILALNLRLGSGSGEPEGERPPGWDGPPVEPLERTPYGERIEDQRWVLRRDALLGYYESLKDDPERIALLYETFKPVYEEDRIMGYRLGIEGEEEFLAAMGLQENDIVRSVNSMDMTSQRRAEFFIREFVQGRMSVAVLEVERDNVRTKKIYEIR